MRRLIYFYIFLCLISSVFGQSDDDKIMTALQYFGTVSETYTAVRDYEAVVTITHNKMTMTGQLFFKSPNKILITFSDPRDQVILVNSSEILIYLPQKSVTLKQQLTRGGDNSKGLALFSQGYTFAWHTNANLMPLEEGSSERVRKLRLAWKNTNEGFREIEMSVGQNGLIRRLVGVTKNYEQLIMDFRNIRINQNIPDARFDYQSPPSSYQIDNFIYSD